METLRGKEASEGGIERKEGRRWRKEEGEEGEEVERR